jgi:hypothetical protein
MHVNAKMMPVETVLGIRVREMKESSERSEFKYDIFETSKNFCKYSKVPPPSTTVII